MMSPEHHKWLLGGLIIGLVIYLSINTLSKSDDEPPLSKTEKIVSSITMNVTTTVFDKQMQSRLHAVSECGNVDKPPEENKLTTEYSGESSKGESPQAEDCFNAEDNQ